MSVTIDRMGRIVVPKVIRDRVHLVPGTVLELAADAEGIRIVSVDSEPSLVRKNGVLIHHGPETTDLDIRRVIDQERENRNDYLVAVTTEGEPSGSATDYRRKHFGSASGNRP